HFDEGYALDKITLQVTDEDVTDGVVEGPISWLYDPKYRTNPIWGSLNNLTQKTISGLKKPLTAEDVK
ncbi:MAG: hypothetical protein AAF826_08225, partial [Pseudomonadota bacterium]